MSTLLQSIVALVALLLHWFLVEQLKLTFLNLRLKLCHVGVAVADNGEI